MEANERADAVDPADPIENSEQTDPADPIEAIDPTEPIERIEPSLAIERIESLEFSDQCDPMLQLAAASARHAC